MKNRDLNSILREATPPKWPEDHWTDFPAGVTRELSRARLSPPQGASPERNSARGFRRWMFATALGCLLVGFLFGLSYRRSLTIENDVADARELMGELITLFPKQIQAIVLEDGRARLVLSDTADVPSATPVFLRICGGAGNTRCERIITFSGQQVRVNGRDCDVLVDARGTVIVAGPDFVWSSAEKHSRLPVQIDARSLEIAL